MAEKLSPAEVTLAGAALDALAVVDGLTAPGAGAPAKVSPTALHAYATDPAYRPAAALLERLELDHATRADFQRLVENTSRFHLPRMAAAASGEIESREAAGCRIVFRPSRADPGQLYAIIEITDPDVRPAMLFIRHADGAMDRLELPELRGGRAQLLLERDSRAARGLTDINAEVFVK